MADSDIMLTPGEQGVFSRKFRSNLLLFWLPTTMVVTNRRIAIKYLNTFLGAIPIGYEERSIPMGSIAGVTTSRQVKVPPLLIFGIISLIGIVLFFNSIGNGSGGGIIGGLLLAVIFGALAANAVRSGIIFTNNGGGASDVTVSPLDSGSLEEFKNKANEYIYSSTDAGTSWQMQGYSDPMNQHNGFGGGQQQGFGGQPQQFGNQQQGSNSSQGFGGQQQGFGGPQQGFGGQPQQFGNQQQGSNSSQGFGSQQQGFGGSQQGFSTGNQSAQNSNSGSQPFNGGQSFGGNQSQQGGSQQWGSDQFSNPNQWGQSSPQGSSSTSSSHSASDESESTHTNERPGDGGSNRGSVYTDESEKKDSSDD
ncbi:hypothetical protein [Corynebacterium sp.]|uniref:hypothetical protein n=1 Tax=Corynebacterium sp. TaxID=1720 RepID=UPI0026DCF66F|nr:hypothetical protein [Corynebacterium sp.]MDO4915641.1 hypothetical protein [Corynebacterium sp.]